MLVWGEAGKNERELPHLCYLILAAQVSSLIPLVQMRKLSPSKFQQPGSGHPLQELKEGGSCGWEERKSQRISRKRRCFQYN